MDAALAHGLVVLALATVLPMTFFALVFHSVDLWRLARRAARWLALRVLPSRTSPDGRPIEVIALNARRLGREFHLDVHHSWPRAEGVRRAYDAVLVEGCRALGVETRLLDVPPGLHRDFERLRVERLLRVAGIRLPGQSLGDAA